MICNVYATVISQLPGVGMHNNRSFSSCAADIVPVPIGALFPGAAECGKIGVNQAVFEGVACGPLEVVHEGPQVVTSQIYAVLQQAFHRSHRAFKVIYAVVVLYDAGGRIDGLLARVAETVFGDIPRSSPMSSFVLSLLIISNFNLLINAADTLFDNAFFTFILPNQKPVRIRNKIVG